MGVTAIKKIANYTDQWIYIQNFENSENGRAFAVLGPNWSETIDMWIPHCTNRGDYDGGKYIEIGTWDSAGWPARMKYIIWQHDRRFKDGDHVRFSTDGKWHDINNDWIPGVHAVDGDRRLEITAISLDGLNLSRWP
jgi:hypothetical protein